MIKIILADDHQIVRLGLRSLLSLEPDMEVLAEADNGREVIRLAREKAPDIVIMDISMPDLNGIEATRQIMSESPGVKVIALSMHSDSLFVLNMLKAGASGYLLKDCALE
jgi:two-component system, NarL family, response regulator NreC